MSNYEVNDQQDNQKSPFDYFSHDGTVFPLLHAAYENGQQLSDVLQQVAHAELPVDKDERLQVLACIRGEGLDAQWRAEKAVRLNDPNSSAVKELADMVSGIAAEYGTARRGVRGDHDAVERLINRNLHESSLTNEDNWRIFVQDNQVVHGGFNRRVFSVPETVDIPSEPVKVHLASEVKPTKPTVKQRVGVGLVMTAALSGFLGNVLPASAAQATPESPTPPPTPEAAQPIVKASNPNNPSDPANLVVLRASAPKAKVAPAPAQVAPNVAVNAASSSVENIIATPAVVQQLTEGDLGLVPATLNTVQDVATQQAPMPNNETTLASANNKTPAMQSPDILKAQPTAITPITPEVNTIPALSPETTAAPVPSITDLQPIETTVTSPDAVTPTAVPIDQIPSLVITTTDQPSQDSPAPTVQPTETSPSSTTPVPTEAPSSGMPVAVLVGFGNNTGVANTIAQEANNTLAGLTPAPIEGVPVPVADTVPGSDGGGTPEVAPPAPGDGSLAGLTPAPIDGTPMPADAVPGNGGTPETAPPTAPALPPVEIVPTPKAPEAPAPGPNKKADPKPAPAPDVPAPTPEKPAPTKLEDYLQAAQNLENRGGEFKYQGMIMKYFIEHGYSPTQATGIVGNFAAESGLDPTRRQGDSDSGDGRGFGQWGNQTNPNYDRFGYDGQRGLVLFAAQQGKSWEDPQVQLDFTLHELETTESAANALLKAVPYGDINGAAVAFQSYERPNPAYAHTDERIAAANAAAVAFDKEYSAIVDARKPKPAPTPPPSEKEKPQESIGQKVVDFAYKFNDYGYLWGGGYDGGDPNTGQRSRPIGDIVAIVDAGTNKGEHIVDCGGLLRASFLGSLGVDIGAFQFNNGEQTVTTPVFTAADGTQYHFITVADKSQAQAGDVFWHPGHVGFITSLNPNVANTYNTFEAEDPNVPIADNIKADVRHWDNPADIAMIYRLVPVGVSGASSTIETLPAAATTSEKAASSSDKKVTLDKSDTSLTEAKDTTSTTDTSNESATNTGEVTPQSAQDGLLKVDHTIPTQEASSGTSVAAEETVTGNGVEPSSDKPVSAEVQAAVDSANRAVAMARQATKQAQSTQSLAPTH